MNSRIKKRIPVKSLISRFDNKIIYKGNIGSNYIYSPTFNRCGLQLASPKTRMKLFDDITSMVVWGTDETKFLNSLGFDKDKKKLNEVFTKILKLKPPLIVLCEGFDFTHEVVACAKRLKSKTTIVKCHIHSHMLYFQITAWINAMLATYQFLHATVVQINGVGVLIQGESGIGKSEVALQLIKRGALFVGDDAVEITNLGNKLYARPSRITSGFMEVRGVGMIDISRAVGINNVNCKTVGIDIIVILQKAVDDDVNSMSLERLRERQTYRSVLGVKVATYNIPVTTGRDVSNMIEAAVSDFKLREQGYNCAHEFDKNLKKLSKEKQ